MSSGKRHRASAVQQQGFTYLAALFLVGIAGAGLAATSEFWSHSRQREKEAELIWIGNQFTQAIALYYHRSPGAVRRYPERLEDLLEDRRYLTMQRYLRRIYADPITGKPEWGLIPAPGGGIMGIHSTAAAKPIRSISLTRDEKSSTAASYREWRFVYEPPTPAQAPPVKQIRS
jgi:type II secretory pathway pseudopilin PulG